MLAAPREIVSDDSLSWTERVSAVVEHWMRFEFEHHGLYHAVFHTVATDSDEPLEATRSLLADLIQPGVDAGEFDTDGLGTGVVVDFLLNGSIGPCSHHTNSDTADDTVKQLFNRVLGALSI